MDTWTTKVEPDPRSVRLLMTDPEGNEVLKAVLPAWPQHPRALLTLLEALALWVGSPLTAAISVGRAVDFHRAEALFGNGLVPMDSALVRFEVVGPARRRRTLAGVGDFRGLRALRRRHA